MTKKIRREIHHTKWVGAVLVGILSVALIVTFTSKKTNKKNTKQIIVGMAQEPNTLDPLFSEMAASFEGLGLIFEDMVERDENWEYHPRMVTEIPSFENGLVKRLPGNKIPVGNGPFQLTEWASGSHMIFERNPNWTGSQPIFEKVIYKFITSTNALESNLLSGTIDAISPLGLSLDQALDFERR